MTLGGVEFYPSCTQVRIGGSQSSTPNQAVSFPGAYNDNDPGIYVPNIYTPGSSYTFPGPPVSNLASPADMTGQLSGNGSSSPGGNTSPSSTAKGGHPTSTNGAGSGTMRSIILDRLLAIPSLFSIYLLTLSMHGIDVTHVFLIY
jgi:AA9 family protein